MMYFYLRLLLASLAVMMKLNHKLLKNVDIEMIGQYEKKTIRTELNSLAKSKVFGPIVHTSKGVIPVGYK